MARFNYTERKKINQSDISITLQANSAGQVSFTASIDLNEYSNLPADAPVCIEAYRGYSWMRFEWGTVGCLSNGKRMELSEFSSTDVIRFRVKVLSTTSNQGLILAMATKLRPLDPDHRQIRIESLLPVRLEDLGEEIWALEYPSAGPVLVVNQKYVKDKIARAPEFACLVYPAALRAILVWILLIEGFTNFEDEEDWMAKWLRFAQTIGSDRDLPDVENHEAVMNWIDEKAQAFSRSHRISKMFDETSLAKDLL